jgi:hypothetical protein
MTSNPRDRFGARDAHTGARSTSLAARAERAR